MPGISKSVGRHRAPRRRPAPRGLITAAVVLAVLIGAGAVLLPDAEQRPAAQAGAAHAGATSAAPGTGAGEPMPGAVSEPTAQPSVAAPGLDPVPPVAPTGATSHASTPTPQRSTAPRTGPAPRTTPAGTPSTTGGGTTGTTAAQVLAIVNQERAANGCGAVTLNSRLTTASQLHSEDQASHGTMTHTGSDGSTPWQRAERVEYDHAIGENVAAGYQTAQAVMDGWMNNPGHRANILDCAARAMGLGVATADDGTRYWTQMFGSVA